MKVSVIMPTANRPKHLERAIQYFLRQDWPDKELIIVADAFCDLTSTMPDEAWAVVKRAFKMGTIGAKRNYACELAQGDIIVHMDDDDWYADDWITLSVKALISTNAELTGLRKAYFYKPTLRRRLWEYTYPLNAQPYVIGASMCYWRRTWQRAPFPDVSEGEDAAFCATAWLVKAHNNQESMIAIIHGGNTASHKQLKNPAFQETSAFLASLIMGDDYEKY